MPSGQVHIKAWRKVKFVPPVFFTLGIGLLMMSAQWYEVWIRLGILYISLNYHWILCRYIDPDLDQLGVTAAEGRMIRELRWVGFFFSAYWTLYAYAINLLDSSIKKEPKLSAHRSWLTHTLFPGTVLRQLWYIMGCAIVMRLVYEVVPYYIHWTYVLYGFMGTWSFFIGDGIHIELDGLPLIRRIEHGTNKRRKRRRRSRRTKTRN